MAKNVGTSRARRAIVGAAMSIALTACMAFGAASPAVAASVSCGWPRCTVYLTKAETNRFAYENAMPSAPSTTLIGIWYIFLMGHRGFVVEYANHGMCVGFNLSAIPWESQGLFGYRC